MLPAFAALFVIDSQNTTLCILLFLLEHIELYQPLAHLYPPKSTWTVFEYTKKEQIFVV